MTRLGLRALGALRPGVARPGFDPGTLRRGIVHLGVGNFHRAHQAAYTDAAIAAGDPRWGIVGVSLRNRAMRDALLPQDGLYTLIERGASGDAARVVGSVRELLVAPESPRAVVERIADPDTRIVSLTVTEKGYCRGADGALDLRAPEVVHDLAQPDAPLGAIGMLHAGAALRARRGLPGFTVLSCDNLSGNGRILRALLLQFAQALGPDASRRDWIEAELAFPDSMVDRIVPHTTDEHRSLARELTGLDDAWPVVTESFSQWVLEDRFVAGRPDWAAQGVQFVDDVSAWEAMKLRLLNAAHSTLAYLGVPAGLETVDRAVAEPSLRVFVQALWSEEVAPTLPARVQPQVPDYCARLLERFANPALGHRTRQIAMDGSQKLPLRLLPSLRARIAAGQPFRRLALAIAAWMRYLEGRTEAGERYAIDDPLAATLEAALRASGGDAEATVAAVLAIGQVFGDDLREDAAVRREIAAQLARLRREGSVEAVRATIAQ